MTEPDAGETTISAAARLGLRRRPDLSTGTICDWTGCGDGTRTCLGETWADRCMSMVPSVVDGVAEELALEFKSGGGSTTRVIPIPVWTSSGSSWKNCNPPDHM